MNAPTIPEALRRTADLLDASPHHDMVGGAQVMQFAQPAAYGLDSMRDEWRPAFDARIVSDGRPAAMRWLHACRAVHDQIRTLLLPPGQEPRWTASQIRQLADAAERGDR